MRFSSAQSLCSFLLALSLMGCGGGFGSQKLDSVSGGNPVSSGGGTATPTPEPADPGVGLGPAIVPQPSSGASSLQFVPSVLWSGKLVDSSSNRYPYSYGPAIIKVDGVYHAYFCSTGTGTVDWDHVRYATSSDLRNWSTPVSLLTSTVVERANCDPSIVYFDAGDGPYYYLFYSGNAVNIQTLNFVARSRSPSGPFLKYTDRRTWEANPRDSHAIVWPFKTGHNDTSNIYGAGQPSVVVKDGVLYQWYTDTTEQLPAAQVGHIFLRTSRNAVDWSEAVSTNVDSASIDVKYDPVSRLFVMFAMVNEHAANVSFVARYSADGARWSDPQTICNEACAPDWANNIGVSGDAKGHLIGDEIIVAFGAPYDLNPAYDNDCAKARAPLCWGNWDLYGLRLNLRKIQGRSFDVVAVAKTGTETRHTELRTLHGGDGFQSFSYQSATSLMASGSSFNHFMIDYDRDGIRDLVAVIRSGGGTRSVEVHVLSGASGYRRFLLQTGTPVAEVGVGANTDVQFEFTDWDRDGVEDLAVIKKFNTASGKVEFDILSGASNYQNYIARVVTAVDQLASAARVFRFTDWDRDGSTDLVYIFKSGTGTRSTEVHIVSGASGFRDHLLHTGTTLPELPDDAVVDLKDWNRDGVPDLVAVLKSRTGTHKTEVHVISGANAGAGVFTQGLISTGTVASEADESVEYIVAPAP